MSLLMLNFSACQEPKSTDSGLKGFRNVNIQELETSVPRLFRKDWSLITAGIDTSFNTMTASWGGMGYLWEKNVAFIFIRPQRYTREFVEREDVFTVSFFEHAKYAEALKICGTKSGRNSDKVKEAGLTPMTSPAGSMSFAEANMVVECRKLYSSKLTEQGFIDTSLIQQNYPQKDFHTMYVGEIINVWIRE